MENNKIYLSVFFIFLFNIIGAVALCFPVLRETILKLTPLNLLLILGMFLYANNDFSLSFLKTILVVFIIGYFIEVLGVRFKFIFGEYYYGETLGLKILNTPLIMGVNWLTLSVSTFGIAAYIFKPKILIVIAASVLMVLTDMLIEPISASLDLALEKQCDSNSKLYCLVLIFLNNTFYNFKI
jgi:putative membrane protein